MRCLKPNRVKFVLLRAVNVIVVVDIVVTSIWTEYCVLCISYYNPLSSPAYLSLVHQR